MKENILFVVLLCAGIGAGFAAGVYVGKDKAEDATTEQRQQSHASRDTSRQIREIQKPPQNREASPAPRLTPDVRATADSQFTIAQGKGEDTLRALYAAAIAPRETTVIFPGLGELTHRSDRINGIEYYGFNPYPQKDTTLIITDTIYYPVQAPKSSGISISKISLVGIGAGTGALFGGPIGAGGGGIAGLIIDWILFE